MRTKKEFWPNGMVKYLLVEDDLGQTVEARFWTEIGLQVGFSIMVQKSNGEYININRPEFSSPREQLV